jgi:predicted transcriptional regulator
VGFSYCYWTVHVTVTEQFILLWLDSSYYCDWVVHVTVTEQFMLLWLNSSWWCDWTVLITVTEQFMLMWLNSSCYCDWTVHVTVTEQFTLLWLNHSGYSHRIQFEPFTADDDKAVSLQDGRAAVFSKVHVCLLQLCNLNLHSCAHVYILENS